jgi:hypothetical protein
MKEIQQQEAADRHRQILEQQREAEFRRHEALKKDPLGGRPTWGAVATQPMSLKEIQAAEMRSKATEDADSMAARVRQSVMTRTAPKKGGESERKKEDVAAESVSYRCRPLIYENRDCLGSSHRSCSRQIVARD